MLFSGKPNLKFSPEYFFWVKNPRSFKPGGNAPDFRLKMITGRFQISKVLWPMRFLQGKVIKSLIC
jgi:hypothetical protein